MEQGVQSPELYLGEHRMWLARIAEGVARAQPAIGTSRNAGCHQSVTHVRTRHGTCYDFLGL